MFFVVTSMATGEEAEVVPFRAGNQIAWRVVSENPAIKHHLQNILSTEAFSLRPGSGPRSVAPLHLLPNTVEFFQCLPEILSWRGYTVKILQHTHKSVDLLGVESDALSIPTHYDARGNLVVSKVPEGYLAVHRDEGRVIAGGRWWLASVEDAGDKWYLLPNPYESESEETRAKMWSYVSLGLEDYHPGINPRLYAEGDIIDEKVLSSRGIFEDRFRLDRLLKSPQPKQHLTANLPTELEPGHVVYNPESGLCFRSELWSQVNLPLQDYTWYLFPEPDLTDDEKLAYEQIYGPSPMFVRGLDRGVVYERPNMDVGQGIPLQMPSLYTPPAFRTHLPLEVNRTKRDELSLDAYAPPPQSQAEPPGPQVAGSAVTLNQLLDDLSLKVVHHLAQPHRYEYGEHGAVVNWYGSPGGITAVCGADGFLRNRGDYLCGRHMTVVLTSPEQVSIWSDEIFRLTGISAFILAGQESQEERWEELLQLVASNNAPHFVVVGTSSLVEELPYLAAPCVGGTLGTLQIPPQSLGILVVDIPGVPSLPGLAELAELVYLGRGRVWVLSRGEMFSTAGELVGAISLVNATLRDSDVQVKDEYLKQGYSQNGRHTFIWRGARAARDFLQKFGHHLLSLDFRHSSVSQTYSSTPPIHLTTSQGWDGLVREIWDELPRAASPSALAILAGASIGWVSPPLLLSYAPARRYIIAQLRNKLDEDFLESAAEELEAYGSAVVGVSASEHAPLYYRHVSSYTQELVEAMLVGWSVPVVDKLSDEVRAELRRALLGRPIRLAIAGLTLPVAEKLKSALSNTPNLSTYLLLPDDEAALDAYLGNKEQHTLAIVLTNRLAEVRIPADRSWYLPTWQPVQIDEVFRLTPKQKHLASLVLPSGLYRYVWLSWGMFYKSRAFSGQPYEVDNVLDYATGSLTRNVANWAELLHQLDEMGIFSTPEKGMV